MNSRRTRRAIEFLRRMVRKNSRRTGRGVLCLLASRGSMPVRKNYLARPKCRHRAPLSLNGAEQCCGVCLPSPPNRIGIMFARLDDLSQRHRRPRDWHIACGNCGNPHEESHGGLASALPGGSGKCGNPLGCGYGQEFSNAVAGAGGVAESAETAYGNSSRGFWRVTGRGTVRQSVLASIDRRRQEETHDGRSHANGRTDPQRAGVQASQRDGMGDGPVQERHQVPLSSDAGAPDRAQRRVPAL